MYVYLQNKPKNEIIGIYGSMYCHNVINNKMNISLLIYSAVR